MPRLTDHFYKLYSAPEEVKEMIRDAYKKGETMEEAARILDISISRLREHCRMLDFDPVKEKRAAAKAVKKPAKKR